MAIKYTREDDESDHGSRVTKAGRRFARYSTAPPSRRALTWIIAATALVVTLLMVVSELTSTTPAVEYVWLRGVALTNETDDVLRVELIREGDEPPHVYDISRSGHEGLAAIGEGDAVRMQVKLDEAGTIASIIRVERDDAMDPPADE